ncbi:MAG: hypothetical protein PHI41_01745 [Erysipelotrichaceae bacterium]|nr:hypothetical protein [Erysipelotrichaceae bacterium]
MPIFKISFEIKPVGAIELQIIIGKITYRHHAIDATRLSILRSQDSRSFTFRQGRRGLSSILTSLLKEAKVNLTPATTSTIKTARAILIINRLDTIMAIVANTIKKTWAAILSFSLR